MSQRAAAPPEVALMTLLPPRPAHGHWPDCTRPAHSGATGRERFSRDCRSEFGLHTGSQRLQTSNDSFEEGGGLLPAFADNCRWSLERLSWVSFIMLVAVAHC